MAKKKYTDDDFIRMQKVIDAQHKENVRLKDEIIKNAPLCQEWVSQTLHDIEMLAYIALKNIAGEYDVEMKAMLKAIELRCASARVFIDDDNSLLETITSSPY